MYEVTPEVDTSNRILLSVNAKPVVMVKPDGNVLIAEGASLSEASKMFWTTVSEYGTRAYANRRKSVQDVAHDMRQFAGKVGGTFGAQLDAWAETLHNAVEEKPE